MSRFLAERYAHLEAYTPGEQPTDMKYIKLNTNESPFPPSPGVIRAVSEQSVRELRLYSDPDCGILRRTIAQHFGFDKQNVFVSNVAVSRFPRSAMDSIRSTPIFTGWTRRGSL